MYHNVSPYHSQNTHILYTHAEAVNCFLQIRFAYFELTTFSSHFCLTRTLRNSCAAVAVSFLSSSVVAFSREVLVASPSLSASRRSTCVYKMGNKLSTCGDFKYIVV